MFFPAFGQEDTNVFLPPELAFTIEYQASQILTDADLPTLKRVVDEGGLCESLFFELIFFGSVPCDKKDDVCKYLDAHKVSLCATARHLVGNPENTALREEVMRPTLSLEDLHKRMAQDTR